MKVLCSAYACDPRVGSEGGIGWNWVRQIARRHDCVLITRENNVDEVARAAAAEGLARLTVVGHDLPRALRWWKRGGRGALPYFYLWQRSLARVARRLDAQHDFDLVQHLTFSSSWIGSGLAAVGKPFLWGPVGQHPRVPARFLLRGDWRARVAEPVKAALRVLFQRYDPFLARTVRDATRILSLGRAGTRFLEGDARLVPLLACGTQVPASPDVLAPRRPDRPLRVLFCGRLVDLKGVRLALEAFAALHATGTPTSLDVVGDGPLRAHLERRARELGIAGAVRLRGHLPHERALAAMDEADVFLFPSFEGAGMVVVEALARGCPVVCLDVGGPSEMVDATRGVRVSARGDFDATAAALARALGHLARNETFRLRLARAARRWAHEVADWDAKGRRLEAVYAEVRDDLTRSRAA